MVAGKAFRCAASLVVVGVGNGVQPLTAGMAGAPLPPSSRYIHLSDGEKISKFNEAVRPMLNKDLMQLWTMIYNGILLPNVIKQQKSKLPGQAYIAKTKKPEHEMLCEAELFERLRQIRQMSETAVTRHSRSVQQTTRVSPQTGKTRPPVPPKPRIATINATSQPPQTIVTIIDRNESKVFPKETEKQPEALSVKDKIKFFMAALR